MLRGLKALILVAALTLPIAAANAVTVYFAGGEDTSFTAVGAAIGVRTSSEFRSSYARASIATQNSTTVADPPANRMQAPTFTSDSSLWFHAEVNENNGGITTTANEQGILFRSPDGVSRIVVRQTGTNGQLKVSKRNAAGTITDLATASGNLTTATTSIDLQIVYGCTAGDQVNLYLAGTQVITFTGASICTDAATQLNQVELASLNNQGSTVTATQWSEVIVADSDTRGMALWTLSPQAAGNTQSWTPNTVGNVNPTAITDSNFVSSTSSSQLSEWTTPTSTPTGTWNLLAIVQEARVETSTTGPQTFEWLVRTKDGSDHVTGTVTPTVGAFANFSNQIWATNPHTSAAWAITDVASGFNLGIESTP
jgi:hypothetical protein